MTKQYDTVCPQPSTLCIRRLQTDFIRTILTEIYHMHLYVSTNELVIANIYIILLGFYAFQIFLLHLLLLCRVICIVPILSGFGAGDIYVPIYMYIS